MIRVPQKSPMIDPVWNLAFPARALCLIPITQLSFFFAPYCPSLPFMFLGQKSVKRIITEPSTSPAGVRSPFQSKEAQGPGPEAYHSGTCSPTPTVPQRESAHTPMGEAQGATSRGQ